MTTTCPSSKAGAATPLSSLIEPELDRPDEASVDLKPYRNSITRAMDVHRVDLWTAYGICCYRYGLAGRIDEVLPGGRLRRALDELLAKGRQ